MSLIGVNDLPSGFLGEDSPKVPRGNGIGGWIGKGRAFRLAPEAGGFCQKADEEIGKAIVYGSETGDVEKYKYTLADVAKTFFMGPSHATASEVEKYFSKPEASQLLIALWDEYADGYPIAACTISFPPFDILDRNVPSAGPAIVPGSKYEEMRRAPAVVVQTAGGASGIPKGNVDSARLQPDGSVRVEGWAFVPSSPSTPVRVEVMSELASGGQSQTRVAVPTGMPRPDVNKSQNVTGNHGFVAIVPPQPNGTYTIYVYAMNQATNENRLLPGSPTNVMVATTMTRAEVSVVDAPRPGQPVPTTPVRSSFDLPSLPSAQQVSAAKPKPSAKISNDKLVLYGAIGISAVVILFALTRRRKPQYHHFQPPMPPMPPAPPPPSMQAPSPAVPVAPEPSPPSTEEKKLNRGASARRGPRRPS